MTGEGQRRGDSGCAAGEAVLDPPFPPAAQPSRPGPAVWHDIECGGYSADLTLWEELAAQAPGPTLELGCGTGRVGLHLGRCGYRVTGLERDVALLAAFRERATGLPVKAQIGDAADFELGEKFALALAPMQLVQLLAGAAARKACLGCVADHLSAGGRVALAIVERLPPSRPRGAPLPDVCEVERWIYSSLPIDARENADSIVIRRLRQTVSPEGALSEELDAVWLRRLSAERLEREAATAGLAPVGRHWIPATDAHVGSTVVLLQRRT